MKIFGNNTLYKVADINTSCGALMFYYVTLCYITKYIIFSKT